MDQREFLRQMEELVDFGRTKENLLTKKEIADYCSDMSLTDKRLEFDRGTDAICLCIP